MTVSDAPPSAEEGALQAVPLRQMAPRPKKPSAKEQRAAILARKAAAPDVQPAASRKRASPTDAASPARKKTAPPSQVMPPPSHTSPPIPSSPPHDLPVHRPGKEPVGMKSTTTDLGPCLLGWDPQRKNQVEEMLQLGFLPSFLAEYAASRSPARTSTPGIPPVLHAAMEAPVRAWNSEMQRCIDQLSLNDKIACSVALLGRSLGVLMAANAETADSDFVTPALATALRNVQEEQKRVAELNSAQEVLTQKLAEAELDRDAARQSSHGLQNLCNVRGAMISELEEDSKRQENELKTLREELERERADKAQMIEELSSVKTRFAALQGEQEAAIKKAVQDYEDGEGNVAGNDSYILAFINLVKIIRGEGWNVDLTPLRKELVQFIADNDTSCEHGVDWEALGGPLTEEELQLLQPRADEPVTTEVTVASEPVEAAPGNFEL